MAINSPKSGSQQAGSQDSSGRAEVTGHQTCIKRNLYFLFGLYSTNKDTVNCDHVVAIPVSEESLRQAYEVTDNWKEGPIQRKISDATKSSQHNKDKGPEISTAPIKPNDPTGF